MAVFKVNEKGIKVQVGFNNSADVLENREAEWDLLAGIAVYSQDKTLYELFEGLPKRPQEYEDAITGGGIKKVAATAAAAK